MPEYIVEAKTVQTGAVRTLKEALKCILVEMSLIFDKDGIRMVAMDQSVHCVSPSSSLCR
jgi:hypothetical protein